MDTEEEVQKTNNEYTVKFMELTVLQFHWRRSCDRIRNLLDVLPEARDMEFQCCLKKEWETYTRLGNAMLRRGWQIMDNG